MVEDEGEAELKDKVEDEGEDELKDEVEDENKEGQGPGDHVLVHGMTMRESGPNSVTLPSPPSSEPSGRNR